MFILNRGLHSFRYLKIKGEFEIGYLKYNLKNICTKFL